MRQSSHDIRPIGQAIRDAERELREAGKIDDAEVQRRLDMNTRPDALDESIKHHRDPVVRESVGEHWHESRKYWRARLEAFFPEPSDLAARTLSEGE